jgi:DNA-binding MarR family transcriptional regulator
MDRIERIGKDWQRERPDLDSTDALLIGRLLQVARQLERVGRATLAPFELGLTDHDVLSALRRCGEPYALKPGQLLEELVLTSGALTSCLDRLESRGLIERRRDPEDGRARVVSLTDTGRDLIDSAVEMRFAKAAAVTDGLSDTDKRRFYEVLSRIERSAERVERGLS